MNAIVYVVLASISLSVGTVEAIKRIPINLFNQRNANKKHYTEDLSEIDKADNERTFNKIDIDNGKNHIDRGKPVTMDLKFTDFILEAAKVLKTYENYDLEQAFLIIDYEVWINMYKGCKSYELADIRRYVSDQLGLVKDEPADTLRQYLDNIIDIISHEDYGEVRDMVVFINSLYIGEYEKFIEVLLALVHKRISADVDLGDILKYALKCLIFDHYCNLDTAVRHNLRKIIKHYWKQFNSQTANYKTDRGINTLPLVTPFIYDNRDYEINKKRRFNTVNEGRPLQKHDNNVAEYSDELKIARKMESGSEETLPCSVREGCHKRADNSENAKQSSNKNDVLLNYTAVGHDGEIVKTVTIDSIRGNIYPIRGNHFSASEEEKVDPPSSKTPIMFQQSNKTLEKLIKIGTLAKEINDIIVSESKSLRSYNNVPDFGNIFGTQMLQLIGDYRDMLTTPEMVKEDGGNGKKDIVISMKAKYQE